MTVQSDWIPLLIHSYLYPLAKRDTNQRGLLHAITDLATRSVSAGGRSTIGSAGGILLVVILTA